ATLADAARDARVSVRPAARRPVRDRVAWPRVRARACVRSDAPAVRLVSASRTGDVPGTRARRRLPTAARRPSHGVSRPARTRPLPGRIHAAPERGPVPVAGRAAGGPGVDRGRVLADPDAERVADDPAAIAGDPRRHGRSRANFSPPLNPLPAARDR